MPLISLVVWAGSKHPRSPGANLALAKLEPIQTKPHLYMGIPLDGQTDPCAHAPGQAGGRGGEGMEMDFFHHYFPALFSSTIFLGFHFKVY